MRPCKLQVDIQSVAVDRALRNTVLYGLLFMVLSPVTNVIIALLLFEITSRRRLKTYQTIITFPNFMSMVIVGYIVYAILSPRTGLMNQIIQFFGGDPVDVYMNAKYWPFILTVVNIWKGIGMGSMMYFAALMGIDTSLYLKRRRSTGSRRFQKMLHISLPHLVPLICIFTIMNAGTLISGNFDLFYVIPRNTSTLYATTDILNTYVYRSLQESSYAIGATTASFVRCGYVPCSAVQLDRQEDLPGQLDVLSGRENLMNPKTSTAATGRSSALCIFSSS